MVTVPGAGADREWFTAALRTWLRRSPGAWPAAKRINEELEASAAAGFEDGLTVLGSGRCTLLLASHKELLAVPSLSGKAAGSSPSLRDRRGRQAFRSRCP